MKKLSLLFLLSLSSTNALAAIESVTCLINNIPDGKMEKYILFAQENSAALLNINRNQKSETQEGVLITDLECVKSKSDLRVVNCVHNAPAGSTMLTDASLTIIKHTYVSAGSVRNRAPENVDNISESYKFYFRDDRTPKNEISKNFFVNQCRASSASELDQAKALLKR